MDKGYVVFAKFDSRNNSCLRKVQSVKKVLPKSSQLIVESSKTEAKINEFENSLIIFLNSTRTGERVPLVTDFYLPAGNLEKFVEDLKVLEKSLKLDLALYGSYSASNYHLRPKFKVEDPDFSRKAVSFLRAGAYIVEHEGGSITGGSPEGRVKALVTNETMSESEKGLYSTIKQIFDRYDIMNPAVKLGADSRFTITHFRTTSSSKVVI